MDFCVIITIADDGEDQLDVCLAKFRAVYNDVPVHVISDGVDCFDYHSICMRYGVKYTAGDYLKRAECAGMWWERVLSAGLAYDTKWICKMDPDVIIWRKFAGEPRFPVTGTIENPGKDTENIQGGFQVIHRDVAKKILNERIMLHDDVATITSYLGPTNPVVWYPNGFFTTDYSLMYALQKLSIPWGEWSEIKSCWRVVPSNDGLTYAVTHPHKIPVTYDGVPQDTMLHLITTCKGRLHHLRQTLPRFLSDPHVEVTVVDYDCPDGTADWLADNHPQVNVVRLYNEPIFNRSRAKNVGAQHTKPGWWMFIDADILLPDDWGSAFRKSMRPGCYHISFPPKKSTIGTCIVHSTFYHKSGGYDEVIQGWGPEDIDFYTSLRHVGCRPHMWPCDNAEAIEHGDDERTEFHTFKRSFSENLYIEYMFRKHRWIVQNEAFPTESRRARWADGLMQMRRVL